MLKPHWIKTTKPWVLGYGITAGSPEDAEGLLRLVLEDEYVIIKIDVVETVQSLDQGHVVHNMGNILRRGIWYPPGHEHLTP